MARNCLTYSGTEGREVTGAQYKAVMEQNSSPSKPNTLPVNRVSWNDATEFCRRLSQKEGRTYRLPTEAEWEYACRAGTSTDYWWGNDAAGADPNKANGFGLFDMHGSLGEWCYDWYGLYYESPEQDPHGPKDPADPLRRRIVRGMIYRGKISRYYDRWSLAPETRYDELGFRVVLDPNAPEDSATKSQ